MKNLLYLMLMTNSYSFAMDVILDPQLMSRLEAADVARSEMVQDYIQSEKTKTLPLDRNTAFRQEDIDLEIFEQNTHKKWSEDKNELRKIKDKLKYLKRKHCTIEMPSTDRRQVERCLKILQEDIVRTRVLIDRKKKLLFHQKVILDDLLGRKKERWFAFQPWPH